MDNEAVVGVREDTQTRIAKKVLVPIMRNEKILYYILHPIYRHSFCSKTPTKKELSPGPEGPRP